MSALTRARSGTAACRRIRRMRACPRSSTNVNQREKRLGRGRVVLQTSTNATGRNPVQPTRRCAMANVRVKRHIWESLSPQQQAQANESLRSAGLLAEGDAIVPSDVASVGADASSGTGPQECISVCFDIYSMAVEQCGDGDPSEFQECMSAANDTLQACLKNCGGSAT